MYSYQKPVACKQNMFPGTEAHSKMDKQASAWLNELILAQEALNTESSWNIPCDSFHFQTWVPPPVWPDMIMIKLASHYHTSWTEHTRQEKHASWNSFPLTISLVSETWQLNVKFVNTNPISPPFEWAWHTCDIWCSHCSLSIADTWGSLSHKHTSAGSHQHHSCHSGSRNSASTDHSSGWSPITKYIYVFQTLTDSFTGWE